MRVGGRANRTLEFRILETLSWNFFSLKALKASNSVPWDVRPSVCSFIRYICQTGSQAQYVGAIKQRLSSLQLSLIVQGGSRCFSAGAASVQPALSAAAGN